MKLSLFSIHDSKAEAFIQPFFAINPAVAIRQFTTAVNDPTTQFSQTPGDYTLFELGTFEQDNAKFDLHKTPINHGLAIAFKTQAPMTIPMMAAS